MLLPFDRHVFHKQRQHKACIRRGQSITSGTFRGPVCADLTKAKSAADTAPRHLCGGNPRPGGRGRSDRSSVIGIRPATENGSPFMDYRSRLRLRGGGLPSSLSASPRHTDRPSAANGRGYRSPITGSYPPRRRSASIAPAASSRPSVCGSGITTSCRLPSWKYADLPSPRS